jgi:uncharacterized protein YndB with AHSA1/START domain
MPETEFVYVTYIASTPKRVWDALIAPEFTREYWGNDNVSDWKSGSKWEHRDSKSGELRLVGKVVESDPPRRLVVTWALPRDAGDPGAHSRVTFELVPIDEMVRLTVTHDRLVAGSDMEKGIVEGWPRVLSSLKSFLETGKPLPTWAGKRS